MLNEATAEASNRAMKLQKELETLKAVHGKIKRTHRTLCEQNMAALDQMSQLQQELNYVRFERDAAMHAKTRLQEQVARLENRKPTKAQRRRKPRAPKPKGPTMNETMTAIVVTSDGERKVMVDSSLIPAPEQLYPKLIQPTGKDGGYWSCGASTSSSCSTLDE